MVKPTDYQIAKDILTDIKIPKYHIGQEVETDIGVGIIVSIEMPYNGLYISPERTMCVVWFSTEGAKGGFVNRQFKISELKPVN